MRWAVLLLAGAVLCGGCKRWASEPTYKGKPRSEWIRLAGDADYDTRKDAVRALAELGGEESKASLVANIDTAIDQVSIPAMYGAAAFPDTDGAIVPRLRSLLKQNPTFWAKDEVVSIFVRMGRRAAPLAPDLNRGLADPNPLPGEADKINAMIRAIQ